MPQMTEAPADNSNADAVGCRSALRIPAAVVAFAGCIVVVAGASHVLITSFTDRNLLPVGIGIVVVWVALRAFRGPVARRRTFMGVLAGVGVYTVLALVFMWPGVTWHASFASGSGYLCVDNLRQIDAAKEQAALEHRWTNGTLIVMGSPDMARVNSYIKGLCGTTNVPRCRAGGSYTYNPIGANPVCSFGTSVVSGQTHPMGLWSGRRRVSLLLWEEDVSVPGARDNHRLPTP